MWPKMLFELLPHFARLMPMADKYLSSRSVSEKAQAAALASQQAALSALAIEVRGELGKATEANSGVSRQLQEQGRQIAELGVEVARARLGVESVEARVGKLEKTAESIKMLVGVSVGMLTIALVLIVFLLVRGTH
ncbi:MAG: hypothetical protein M3O31_06085 [Acidobacteriota bacterium]|nr:hypothetical protein [Acidobacteriota bacterium]